MENNVKTSDYLFSAKRDTALPHDAALLRMMLFQSAPMDICIATYYQLEEIIFIETRHHLPIQELKKIRHQLYQKGLEAGWKMASEAELQLCINGVLSKYIRHSRQHHQLYDITTFAIKLFQDKPLLLCVAGVDNPLDDEFLLDLQVLASTPEIGARALLTKVLQKSEDLELILAEMIDGVILCDDETRIRFMNEKARKLCGFEKIPRRGSTLQPSSLCDLNKPLFEAINDGISQLNRVIPLGNNNSRLLGVNIHHIKNFSSKSIGWLLILRDITASWQSDQIRSMVSVASHELNTPLASMKNTVDLLLDYEAGALNDSQKKFLKILQDDLKRLQRLLHDLLDLSRLEEGKVELDRRRHVRIEFIIHKVIESYTVLAESRGITLKAKIPAGISGFTGDRDRITQILVNLVDNAIKYSHFGGEVIISAKENKKELIVAVADQGVGISKEDLGYIFNKFVQLDNLPDGSHRGFGLGLSIAQEIVHSHGGRLWADSSPGKGSTFYFSIPNPDRPEPNRTKSIGVGKIKKMTQ